MQKVVQSTLPNLWFTIVANLVGKIRPRPSFIHLYVIIYNLNEFLHLWRTLKIKNAFLFTSAYNKSKYTVKL